jgi:drug/metabolite transporter (DMT)-like permease
MSLNADLSAPRISPALATVGVALASVLFGLVPYFARSLTEAGMAPHSVAFYRFALGAVIFLPALWAARAQWRVLLWGVAFGAAMGLGWVAYVRAIEVAPVSVAGVLYMTYPIFTLLLSWALFADRPSGRAMVAAGVILLAAMLSGGLTPVAPAQFWALLLSLAAPAGFGFGIAVLVHRMPAVPPFARMGSAAVGSVLGLSPLVLTTPLAQLIPPDAAGWWLIAGIALGTALVPQLVYVVCSPVVGTARTAVAGSLELPAMFVTGWLLLGEGVDPLQWLACALVVGAIALSPSRATRNVTTNIAKPPRG